MPFFNIFPNKKDKVEKEEKLNITVDFVSDNWRLNNVFKTRRSSRD